MSLRRTAAALLACTCLATGAAYAQDATWIGGNVGDPNEWIENNNWTPATVPTGTATFGATGVTSVANDNGIVAIGTVNFMATAQAYTFSINNPFIINGIGVANNSVNTQTFNVTGGDTLVLQNASSANSGAGAVAYNNNGGGFISFNDTSNAGNANTSFINNSIIQFNDSSNAGNASFTNNVQIDFFSSASTANASIFNADTGTLTFNNSATAASAAINNHGMVIFGNTSTAGNANITNTNIATLTFNDSSSAGGATVMNAGTLNFNNSSTGGNANITNTGGMTFTDASSAGAAAILNTGGGVLTFDSNSTAGNAAITNLSSMDFEDLASAGSSTIHNVGPTGSLSFNNSSTAGSAIIINDSDLTFNNFSNAGSAIITNNQTATFNNFADAGTANIANNGTLTFTNLATADAATIATNIGGKILFLIDSTGSSARFITNGGGTFDMSGLTNGGMTAGSIEGAGNYFLGGNALTVGSNDLSTTVTGVISDGGASGGAGGSLIKVGNGTLTLTNTEAYTSATTIDGGALNVTGSIALSSSVTVNSAGALEGTGTVSSTTINSGGIFAPGAPGAPGTSINVAGSLAFLSGAIYLVQLNPATSTFANVTGATSLNGTVDAVFAPGNYVQKQYTILVSNSVINGTFNALDTFNLPANFTATLSYSVNDVFLNLKASIPNAGLNVNQQNVATALNNFFNDGGVLPPTFTPIFNLSGAQLANALTQLDGEVATGADKGAFLLMDEFLSVMLDPFVDGRIGGLGGGPMGFAPDQQAALPPDVALAYAGVFKAPPPAPFAQRWTTWGSAFGGGQTTHSNAVIGSNNVSAQAAGFAGGMDYHVSPDTVVGFGLSGGETGWSLAQGLGTGRSDAFQAGVYATTRAGPLYLAAALAGAEHWMSTSRVALGDQLTANFNGHAWGGRIEAGYRYGVWSGVGVTPYVAAQYQAFHTPFYREADAMAGGFGLSYNAQNATDTRSELGFRLEHLTTAWGMPLLLRGRLAWAHDWASNPALTATFQSLPGASFVVNGAATPPDSALVTAGSEWRLSPHLALLTKFDGEFAPNAQTYAGSGTLRYSW
jgi:autotransporter-associated beta strand protein